MTENLDNFYPFLINDLMKYIEVVKESGAQIALLDIILDYSLKNDISVEMIGDAISSDQYFKSFVEKDCELYNFILTDNAVEEW